MTDHERIEALRRQAEAAGWKPPVVIAAAEIATDAEAAAIAAEPVTHSDVGELPRVKALNDLHRHLDTWYAHFDWQAMEFCLCAVVVHYAAMETQAIWPFIIGAPRTGKTEAVIRSFERLPQVYSAGDITPKALMSANEKCGLLAAMQANNKAIILFKDFTSMLGKRIEDAAEVMSVFREIADGNYSRWTGNGEVPPWEGKITIIAGVTESIEEHRAVLDALGPRFLFIRWSTPPAREVGQRAIQQIKHEGEIRARSQQLVAEILKGGQGLQLAELTDEHMEKILDLCEVFVALRQPVVWDWKHHNITRIYEREGSGAIAKHLYLVARARATLYGRQTTNDDDLALARRIALDSIPINRLKVYRGIQAEGPEPVAVNDLARAIGLPYWMTRQVVSELSAIGCVYLDEDANVVSIPDKVKLEI